MADLLADVLAVMRPIAAVNLVELNSDAPGSDAPGSDAPGSGEYWVWADRRRLRQVLLQLLSNGIKYNEPNGRLELTCVLVPDQNELRLSVTDTGCGIRPAEIEGLSIPFERVAQKRSDIEGTGIGLALSFHLVSLMGGRMDVQSESGVGSAFNVSIPLVDGRLPVVTGSRLDAG